MEILVLYLFLPIAGQGVVNSPVHLEVYEKNLKAYVEAKQRWDRLKNEMKADKEMRKKKEKDEFQQEQASKIQRRKDSRLQITSLLRLENDDGTPDPATYVILFIFEIY